MKKTFGAVLLCFCFAQAHAQLFTAILSGLNEVPPNFSTGSGTVNVTLDDALNTLTFTSGSYTLDAGNTSIAAHIHGPAPSGVDADVKYNLAAHTTLGVNSGTFSGTLLLVTDPGGPSYSLTQQKADLNASQWYINVHSDVFPGGELRGQLVPVPEPGTSALLAALCLAAFVAVRRLKTQTA